MYKVFYRKDDRLHSMIKSFTGKWPAHYAHTFTEGEWNKPRFGAPFIAFKGEMAAQVFAKREVEHAADGTTYEIWYCHGRGIKKLDFVLDTGLDDDLFIEQFDGFWKVAYDWDLVPLQFTQCAPLGSVSCERIKPIECVRIYKRQHWHVTETYGGKLHVTGYDFGAA